MAAHAPIDAFGVGSDLATSADEPKLGAIYKLVEIEEDGVKRHTAKYSPEKITMPGAKQVFRFANRDVIGVSTECIGCPPAAELAEALQRPVIMGGELLGPMPGAREAREHRSRCVKKLPPKILSLFEQEDAWRVEYSRELLALAKRVRREFDEAKP
jgi:nicotinate phosphoribosyltransferase